MHPERVIIPRVSAVIAAVVAIIIVAVVDAIAAAVGPSGVLSLGTSS
jgi:hypothetical protein